jgi:Protein of unknown function (DUF2637)
MGDTNSLAPGGEGAVMRAWKYWPASVKLTAFLAGLVTLAGWALSFDALVSGAHSIGIRPQLTWVFPIVIDGLMATCYFATFSLRNASFWTRSYVWVVLLWTIVLSVTGNALHAWLHRDQIEVGLALAIPGSAVPALSLALVIHVHVILARAVLPGGDALQFRHETPSGPKCWPCSTGRRRS